MELKEHEYVGERLRSQLVELWEYLGKTPHNEKYRVARAVEGVDKAIRGLVETANHLDDLLFEQRPPGFEDLKEPTNVYFGAPKTQFEALDVTCQSSESDSA